MTFVFCTETYGSQNPVHCIETASPVHLYYVSWAVTFVASLLFLIIKRQPEKIVRVKAFYIFRKGNPYPFAEANTRIVYA